MQIRNLFTYGIVPRVNAELHLRDLLVDLLHEVNDEVDQLVAVHLLRVEVRDQETVKCSFFLEMVQN